MPSAPCWNTAVRHQARNKPEDLPRGARKAAVSDIPIRFERSPRTGQEELAGFFLAAVGIVSSESRGTTLSGPDAAHRRSGGHGVVAFILLTERSGARLYPAGGAAW